MQIDARYTGSVGRRDPQPGNHGESHPVPHRPNGDSRESGVKQRPRLTKTGHRLKPTEVPLAKRNVREISVGAPGKTGKTGAKRASGQGRYSAQRRPVTSISRMRVLSDRLPMLAQGRSAVSQAFALAGPTPMRRPTSPAYSSAAIATTTAIARRHSRSTIALSRSLASGFPENQPPFTAVTSAT